MKNCNQPIPNGEPTDWTMSQLENFGRISLSRHFFMRDMLYSEVASVHGIRNVPDDPALAVEVGTALCRTLLEPLRATFGHLTIRSAFRSCAVNKCGEKYATVARTNWNYSRHVWDCLDENGKRGGTACVVVPWFVDYLKTRPDMTWKAMAWWILDHLRYSEVMFFHNRKFNYAAFNIRWHETDERRWIRSTVDGALTKQAQPEFAPGAHASEYPGFPTLKPIDDFFPDYTARSRDD